jgi:hypothetical protein
MIFKRMVRACFICGLPGLDHDVIQAGEGFGVLLGCD